MQAKRLLMVLLLVAGTSRPGAFAQEDPPPPELLEFLADWETEGGRWIDPATLDQIPLPDEEKDHEKEDS